MIFDQDNSFLSVPDADEYFRANGTLPPIISEGKTPGETRLFLRQQIDSMHTIAEGSTDREISERLAHEIGYLTSVLDRLRQQT